MIDEKTGLPRIPDNIAPHGDAKHFFWRIEVVGLNGYLEVQLRYKPFRWTPSALVRKAGPLNTKSHPVLYDAARVIIDAEVEYVQRRKLAGDYPPKFLSDNDPN